MQKFPQISKGYLEIVRPSLPFSMPDFETYEKQDHLPKFCPLPLKFSNILKFEIFEITSLVLL